MYDKNVTGINSFSAKAEEFSQCKFQQDAFSGVNSACRENRQELDIHLSIYSGRGKHT